MWTEVVGTNGDSRTQIRPHSYLIGVPRLTIIGERQPLCAWVNPLLHWSTSLHRRRRWSRSSECGQTLMVLESDSYRVFKWRGKRWDRRFVGLLRLPSVRPVVSPCK